MGKTALQKIVESHLVRTLPDGSMVLKLDRVWGHEITTPNAILDMQARGIDVVFNPNKVKTMIDHVNPAKDTASAIQGKIVREWSKGHDIEFLDAGRNGVCHAIIPEKGWILPGEIGIMGDSHTCTHGAFGAFTAGVGTTELENGIITGLWICPPQKVIRVNFTGKLPPNVFAKDLILTLISKIGVKGATNAVLEFGGNTIDEMSMEGRMTITNMAVEAGATSGMMVVDDKTIAYLPFRSEWHHFSYDKKAKLDFFAEMNSDSDAEYAQTIDIDVTGMVPVMTNGYSPQDVINVSDYKGILILKTEATDIISEEVVEVSIFEQKPINQVYIGSCTNGRIEDLRIAAGIFRFMNGKVADGVRCIVVPATQYIYERALEEGIIMTFIKAGCVVSNPSCGACLGMSCGVIAPGEVCVSTTNRNFPGRMGKNGMVHLVSPATAALTAINGVVSEPSLELCRNVKKIPAYTLSPTSLTGWEEKEFTKPDYSLYVNEACKPKYDDFSGKVFYLPANNVDTDQIIPAKYLNEIEKSVFGKHCLEDASISAEDRKKLYQSQILVADENFGCGSSREHAPWALEGAGIRCVIAQSFARIFENNMFAIGLICIALPKEDIDLLMRMKPEDIEVDLEKGKLHWRVYFGTDSCGKDFDFSVSDHQKDLIKNGGSVGVMLKLAAELQKEGKI